ncbi:MAG TPA: hypothetical protein VL404_02920 [Candidatus Eisenbacteria bacterium]|nr:hypothetical protein [Candidatus Eisenbacteria bacterium]
MLTSVQTEGSVMTRRPLVSWGAVFAGWLIGNAVMLLIMNLGSAIGLHAVNLTRPETAKGVAVGAAVWTFVAWGVSFYLSGLFAAWLAGNVDRAVGAAHGICVWAMAAAATVLLTAFLTLAGLAGTILAGNAAAQSPTVRQEVGQAIDANAPGQAAYNAGATPIDRAVQGVSGEIRNLRAQAPQKAEQAAEVSAGALWVAFLASVIGLAAAAFGGSMGANRLVVSYRRF